MSDKSASNDQEVAQLREHHARTYEILAFSPKGELLSFYAAENTMHRLIQQELQRDDLTEASKAGLQALKDEGLLSFVNNDPLIARIGQDPQAKSLIGDILAQARKSSHVNRDQNIVSEIINGMEHAKNTPSQLTCQVEDLGELIPPQFSGNCEHLSSKER